MFDQTFQLAVTPGGIIRALHRVAARAEPTYQALVTAVQESPHVVPDETSWRENGCLRWLWVYTTPTTTVYRITPGRGFADATLVLPATYAGALTRDGWVAYRDYGHAGHQSCLRHLLRRCELPAPTRRPDTRECASINLHSECVQIDPRRAVVGADADMILAADVDRCASGGTLSRTLSERWLSYAASHRREL